MSDADGSRKGSGSTFIHFSSIATFLLFAALAACSSTIGSAGSNEVGTKRDAIRCSNGLGVNELAVNAISANRSALDDLVSNTLTTATFSSTGPGNLHYGLAHDRARRFMGYLVNCALSSFQAPVEWDNPFPPFGHSTFRGFLGLCEQWGSGPFPLPDDCLERVAACVYGARINPELKRVPISIRGQFPTLPLLPAIPTDTHLRLSPSLVPSLSPCPSPMSGETRNCGWATSFAGTCSPGAVVAVSAGAPRVDTCAGPILGSGTLPNVLRACSGIYGCDFGSGSDLASSLPGQCGTPGPGVVFNCPSTGDFSIMVGPLNSPDPSDAVAGSDGADTFPGPEVNVFANAEMAVYGNPFQSCNVNPHILDVTVDRDSGRVLNADQQLSLQDGPIFLNMWSCWARQWTAAQAYLAHRLCGVPGVSNCVAHMLDACFRTSPADSQCDIEDGGEGDFEQCRDATGHVWMNPLTTYLNQPCDALADRDQEFCQRGCGFEGPAPTSTTDGLTITTIPRPPSSLEVDGSGDCEVLE